MKEFFKTNTVTYNLMSFTGFKSILIFSQLLEAPKSYEELQYFMKTHEYLREDVSIDTLRIYLNSLRRIGCDIEKITDDGITRYHIASHPFMLKIDDKQAKSIIKVYRAISKSISVKDLIYLQRFFSKISQYVSNQDLKNKLDNISPIRNIDERLIEDLMNYAQNNTEIVIYYNSPTSGRKNITLVVDKVSIENGKLYVSGYNSDYENYSGFLVSKILKIVSVNIHEKTLSVPNLVVGYEYRKVEDENFELLPEEKIIKDEDNKLLIEITSKNKFKIIQRIMSHSCNCKVLYPVDFRNQIIENFKRMKEDYVEEQ